MACRGPLIVFATVMVFFVNLESAALAAEADGASQELQSEVRALAHTLDSFSHHETGEGKATGGAVHSRAA